MKEKKIGMTKLYYSIIIAYSSCIRLVHGEDLLSGITETILCQSGSNRISFGMDHNVALETTSFNIEDQSPADLDSYLMIIKDQASHICDGDTGCLASLDTFTIEAMNYVNRENNMENSQNSDGFGVRRRLTEMLPQNDLSNNVLEILERVLFHVSLDTEEEIIEALEGLELEIEKESDPDRVLTDEEKFIFEAAVSVAKSSTSYWHGAIKDESNSYRRLQVGNIIDCTFSGISHYYPEKEKKTEDSSQDSKRYRKLRGVEKNKAQLKFPEKLSQQTSRQMAKYNRYDYNDDPIWDDYDDWNDPCSTCRSWDECNRCNNNRSGSSQYNGNYPDYNNMNYKNVNRGGNYKNNANRGGNQNMQNNMGIYDYQSSGGQYNYPPQNGYDNNMANRGYNNHNYQPNRPQNYNSRPQNSYPPPQNYNSRPQNNYPPPQNYNSPPQNYYPPPNGPQTNRHKSSKSHDFYGPYNYQGSYGNQNYNPVNGHHMNYQNQGNYNNYSPNPRYDEYYDYDDYYHHNQKGNYHNYNYMNHYFPDNPRSSDSESSNSESSEDIQNNNGNQMSESPSADSQTFFEKLGAFLYNVAYVIRADVVGVIIGVVVGRGCVLPAVASSFLFSALYAVCFKKPGVGFFSH